MKRYSPELHTSDHLFRIFRTLVDIGIRFTSQGSSVHGRVDGVDLETGVVAQAGIDPSASFGEQSLSFPINVAVNSDEFHGGDSGFTYANAGVSTSFDLGKGTSFDVGATYWLTNEDALPNNEEESFATVSAGVGFSF